MRAESELDNKVLFLVARQKALEIRTWPTHLDSLGERSLVDKAELEGVAPDLDHVVEEGAQASQGVGRAEQGHVAKLDEHLEVVVKCSLVLGSWSLHLHLTHLSWSGGRVLLRSYVIIVMVNVLITICLLVSLQFISDISVGIVSWGTQSSKQVKAHFCQLQLFLGVRQQRLLWLKNKDSQKS